MSKRTEAMESALQQHVATPVALVLRLRADGTFPNNVLPLLVYRGAVRLPEQDPAGVFEELFAANGWGGSWRDGINPDYHYHSTTHEVLGVYAGWARVEFGGEFGTLQELRPGDVVIIPAGVAHKNLRSSADFGVVGAYPQGRDWDMNYGKPGERPRADRNILQVPLPRADPVYGEHGPLVEHWGTD